jgi:hypothetical protein
MTISRRKFVTTGLLSAAVAISVPSVFSQSFKERDGNPGEAPPAQTDPLENYSKASFVSYLNSIFQIQTARGIVEVMLANVEDMPAGKGGECFSLLFRGGRAAMKQDTYVVVHPALGTFELFLVPAGSDRNGAQEYLATINRLSLADFSRVAAPTRIAASGQSNRSSSTSSAGNSMTTPASTSTTNSSTTLTTPTVTPTIVSQPATTAAPNSPWAIRRGKRKPASKRVDKKSSVIN